MIKKIGYLMLLSSFSQNGSAITMDFQGFVEAEVGGTPFCNRCGTIGDFHFENFTTVDGATYVDQTAGYATGWIGESTVGYIPGPGTGGGGTTITRIDNGAFDFNSVYLTSAWDDVETVSIYSWSNGSSEYTDLQTFIIMRSGPELIELNLLGIDKIHIYGSDSQVIFDNMTLNAVPVPAAIWLFGSGLIGLAGFARRKKQHYIF